MAVIVRRAAPYDVDWLLGELKQFAEFVDSDNLKIEPQDEDYARSQLTAMVNYHFVIVAEDVRDNFAVPLGLLGAYEVPHPFKPRKKLLSEQWWWVTPSARGSRAALMLLNAYVEHGKETADIVTIALEEKSPINQKSLEKRGFKLVERSFVLVKGAA